MEFWGIEVKAKQKLKVQPEQGKLVHISQAAIGEAKDVEGPKNVLLRMMTGDKNFIIGSLSAEKRPQLMFDLVFEKEFELSHDLEKGSVYFMGYIADDPEEDLEYSDGDEDEEALPIENEASDEEASDEEALPIEALENGTIKAKAEDVKPAAAGKAKKAEPAVAGKAKKQEPAGGKAKKEVKVAMKNVGEDSDDDDEDDSDFDSDEEMALDGFQADSSDISGDDSDEEAEDDSSEEEELPKELPKGKQSKKRQAESAEKIPAAKKAKSATPDKTGKKGQNLTTTPSKSAGKIPNKPKEQTPKSGGQPSGKSFTKPMSSGKKAKHGRK